MPDWLPQEAWDAYILMRKQMGKKHVATEYAQKLLIKKLDGMRLEGQNVEAVINESIMRGWTGLFAIKGAVLQHGGMSKHGQETANSMNTWLQEDAWLTQTSLNSRH